MSRWQFRAALLCCLALAVVPMAGGVAVDGAGVAPIAAGESEHRVVDERFENATGTVEAVVRVDGERPAANGGVVEQLQAAADAAQAPLREFAADRAGVTVAHSFWLANAALVRVDTDRVPVARLATIEGVTAVTPNVEVELLAGDGTRGRPATVGTATDDVTDGLEALRVGPVWETVGTRGENTSVAVLDTGVDPDHPDIDLAKWAEFDAEGNEVDSEPQEYDDSGHGTHVSGTVAGGAASGTHIGVAPETDLYHAAVLTDCEGGCSGTFAQITGGMEWAVENDADVLSMSLGSEGYFDEFIEPVRNADLAGTAVVAAVGNNGEGTSDSPANVYDAVSVGATDESESVGSFSAGEEIDTLEAWTAPPPDWPTQYVVPSVTAPGVLVESAEPGGGYDTESGTSMATPHVAGAVALVQSATDEHVPPADIEAALEATARKPDDAPAPPGERDTRYGAGIVDVPAAIVHLDGPVAAFTVDPPSPEAGTAATFDAGDSLGDIDSYEWEFTGDGEPDATGETASHTFDEEGPANVTLTVTDGDGRTDSQQRPLYVGLEPVVGESLPRDLTGDGLYRDVDGDGTFDIFDVQAFFGQFQEDAVQENAGAFDFDGDGAVDIFDVQRLFDDLRTDVT